MEWRRVIEGHEEEIREKIKEIEVDAYLNDHLRFCLYIDTDGEFHVLQDVAGGNSFYNSENLFHLHTAEHQCYDILTDGYDGSVEDLSRELSYNGVFADVDAEMDLCDFIAYCDNNYHDAMDTIREEMAEDAAELAVDWIFENILENLEWTERD